ncbi:MAG TPA: ATP-binding cassette domain-containing protein [Candidatus Udaeobacter sp.]|nr:ATP-binding cassette domain-containing protein [Candidatus Udaeobacter sp.]
MAIARLNRLTYWYPGAGAPALDSASLSVDGGVTLVAGPSGGGKSTLLRVLNGLVPHFHGGRIAGDAHVAGMNVFETPTRVLARKVGFVFQDPELQTVYEIVEREVAFALENFAFPAREIRRRVDEALHQAGVSRLGTRRVRTLSGGERQRVALASCLAAGPEVVVLDEPTSQLDPEGAAMVLAAVEEVAGTGRSVVVSEHRIEALISAAATLVEVERGRTTQVNPAGWRATPVERAARSRPPRADMAWSLSDVTAGFGGNPVLDGVTLGGCRGEVLALSGRNGGGKTTLLRVIAGTLAPASGKVERRPGRIAYLPQNPTALLHRPTLRSEVELTLRRANSAEPAEAILQMLGLSSVAGRYPRDLSSGERQRAALAAVLPGRPDLVLLDEPTRGMDQAARGALTTLVMNLREAGSSIVIATHDEALQAAVADRVAVVDGGRVRETQAVP